MKRSLFVIAIAWLLAGWSALALSATAFPTYFNALTIGLATEWRFHPLVVDLNRDGYSDLVATARLAGNPLRVWFGDGKGNLAALKPTWTETGYATLATGDINRDGFPDIVAASHFGGVQTLLSDTHGGFTEKIFRREDGHTGAQLAELNGDSYLDLILLGYRDSGIQVYFGDGTGNWTFHTSLPETRPGRTMPGRAVVVADLNHDGHLDLVAAFQRWGIYIYNGDGKGGFSGGPVAFRSPADTPESLALGDSNKDGHLDIAVNGNLDGQHQANGPDVYLGNGKGEWKAASHGLKVLKFTSAGIALGDLDGDRSPEIVAAGSMSGDVQDGYGVFLFRRDGDGGWQLARDNGLPANGQSKPHSITLADLDSDRVPEIIVLNGGAKGSITIWKRKGPADRADATVSQ